MYNGEMVTSFLEKEGIYPEAERTKTGGLRLSMDKNRLLIAGTAGDLIDLADLLVSLALSGEAKGQHWHIDPLTLVDETSEIPELILLRK